MLWRPPRRSWCMHRILCTACNRNSTRSFERGHDGNILEEAYRGRYARQRLLNFWPESSCGYHAIKRFVCIIQVSSITICSTKVSPVEIFCHIVCTLTPIWRAPLDEAFSANDATLSQLSGLFLKSSIRSLGV